MSASVGGGLVVNQLGHVSSPEFWPAATNSAAAIVVLVVSATKLNAATTGVKLRTTRGSWRSRLGSGWPESRAVSSAVAAGVRSCTGVVLELEVEQSEVLGMLYWFLRTCWPRRGDQMVTGAASTASSATAGVRPWWRCSYGEGTRGRRGENDSGAHRGCSGRRSGLGDALETANSPATVIGVRRGERRRGGDAGLPGTRGAVGRKRKLWRSF